MRLSTGLWFLGLILGLAGCGGGAGSSGIGICDSRTQGDADQLGQCLHWRGEKTGDFQKLCTDKGGLYTEGGTCPAESLVGTCVTDQGFGLFLDYHYYSNQFTTATARTHCESRPSCQFSCVFQPAS